jgi:hypothetical protein
MSRTFLTYSVHYGKLSLNKETRDFCIHLGEKKEKKENKDPIIRSHIIACSLKTIFIFSSFLAKIDQKFKSFFVLELIQTNTRLP